MVELPFSPIGINSRSMGVKLILVCALALLMTIPELYVESLVHERTGRRAAVIKEISDHVGGAQIFLGPTLAIPYSIPSLSPSDTAKHGTYLVFPAQASAAVKTTTEERRRSLFKVPVYEADVSMAANFDLSGVPAAAPQGAVLDWTRAEIVVGASHAHGAQSDALLTAAGKTTILAPATIGPFINVSDNQNARWQLTLFGATAGELARPGGHFAVTSSLHFSGAERIAILAYGKTTQLSMRGDWRSPGFDGGFLPVTRQLSDRGFTSEWSVPFIARGVRAEGVDTSIDALDGTAMGVSFVEVADPYQSVDRSLKYVLLFLGLIFLAYFVFEVTTGKRVHPAQYLLVGLAQIIFYLLLLSLAERAGFDLAFLLAGTATVVLLSANVAWVFQQRGQGLRAFAMFTVLYGLIYLLLRLEDNALLLGALTSFLAIAAGMYLTRKIDWYSSLPSGKSL